MSFLSSWGEYDGSEQTGWLVAYPLRPGKLGLQDGVADREEREVKLGNEGSGWYYIQSSGSRDKETLSPARRKVHGVVTSTHPGPDPAWSVGSTWERDRRCTIQGFENGYTFSTVVQSAGQVTRLSISGQVNQKNSTRGVDPAYASVEAVNAGSGVESAVEVIGLAKACSQGTGL